MSKSRLITIYCVGLCTNPVVNGLHLNILQATISFRSIGGSTHYQPSTQKQTGITQSTPGFWGSKAGLK